MKKIFILLVATLIFFIISGCGPKEQTTTYTLKQDDENLTIQNVHKGDELLQQTVKTVIQYETIGVKTKAKAEKLLEPAKALYEKKVGVKQTFIFKEKEVVEEINLDFKKMTPEVAKELPIVSLPDEDIDQASFKANDKKLVELGFKKVEK